MKNLKPIDYFIVIMLGILFLINMVKGIYLESIDYILIAILSGLVAYVYAEITDWLQQ